MAQGMLSAAKTASKFITNAAHSKKNQKSKKFESVTLRRDFVIWGASVTFELLGVGGSITYQSKAELMASPCEEKKKKH